jgi:hypothetical protein
MDSKTFEQARDLTGVKRKLVAQVGVAEAADVVLVAQKDFEDVLVVSNEEIEAFVVAMVDHLGLADFG